MRLKKKYAMRLKCDSLPRMTVPRAEVLESRTLLNAITQENSLPGTAPSIWTIQPGMADPKIQGFATDISVNQGQTIGFKINDTETSGAYHLEIYRLGYYGGLGARLVATIQPSATECLLTHQPDPIVDPTTKLSDCGNWSVSATWTVPPNATSGVYVANIVRNDGQGKSRIIFVVRNDAGHSDLLFQTSDSTWQAYNYYGTPENPLGGASLYDDVGQASRAFKVSYNRPLVEGDYDANSTINSFFYAEYPMLRFLEANGYDVSYFTDLDTARLGSLIQNHNVFLSVGHDEYWSAEQRNNVQAAMNNAAHPVNLAFFSGNQIFWKTRWENSIDGSNTPYRTLVCYKESDSPARDPQDPPTATGLWRDPNFGPPADAGQPENALAGGFYSVNWYQNGLRGWNDPISVPWSDASLRFWRNTAIARLQPGQSYATPAGYLGYEWNEDIDNGFRPAGLMDLSSTRVDVGGPYGPGWGGGKLVDNHGWYDHAFATHSLTLYRAASGGLVFDANTIQWSWALNGDRWGPGIDFHSYQRGSSVRAPVPVEKNLQQATVNLLADMGASAQTLIGGLVAAAPPADHVPPTCGLTSPINGASYSGAILITGTAQDSGGQVVAVEVSTDGGRTWHPASGTNHWSYTWVSTAAGLFTVECRAVDDSGNLSIPTSRNTISVAPQIASVSSTAGTPPLVFDSSIPSRHAGVELGMKFTSDVSGYVSGVRFFKPAGDTTAHSGELWDSAGRVLATAELPASSPSGWQRVIFSNPVAIEANVLYVVSYHTSNPTFADTPHGLPSQINAGHLHVPSSSTPGGNDVYRYDSPNSSRFPNQLSTMLPNYWVDVLFTAAPLAPATSLFASNAIPANPAGASDPSIPRTHSGVELGLRFTSDIAGTVTGVRFWKLPGDSGTHTGELWDSSGKLLATATFTNESSAGWQQVNFAAPVAIAANAAYIVSYHTTRSNFAFDAGVLAGGIDNAQLHANALADVFNYSGTTATNFPNSNGPADGNYWVDLVFQAGAVPAIRKR